MAIPITLELPGQGLRELAAEIFEETKNNFYNALQHASDGGFVLSLPQLVEARIRAPHNLALWNEIYFTRSEETIVRDYDGKFGKKGEWLYLVLHGAGVMNPWRIGSPVFYGDPYRLGESEVKSLLEGKPPLCAQIQLLRFRDISEEARVNQDKYGLVFPFKEIKSLRGNDISSLADNHLFIARAGGRGQALEYLRIIREVYGKIDVNNSILSSPYAFRKDYAKPLYTESAGLGGGFGTHEFDGKSTFLAVSGDQVTSAVTLDQKERPLPSLEVVMEAIEKYLAPVTREQVSHELERFFK